MNGVINKKILSEIALIYGDVSMPKGFEIDRENLSKQILEANIKDHTFPFSRNWDMLNTYMRDHVNL